MPFVCNKPQFINHSQRERAATARRGGACYLKKFLLLAWEFNFTSNIITYQRVEYEIHEFHIAGEQMVGSEVLQFIPVGR